MEKSGYTKDRAVGACAGVLAISLLFYAATVLFNALPTAALASASVAEDGEYYPAVILDAGHGGEDSGTVGVTGIYEKDVNLSISRCLAAMLRSAGYRVTETRTTDRMLYGTDEDIRGYRKIYDLKNRLAIAEKYKDAIFVSIHMNSYPSEKCHGMEVYYPKGDDESRRLADLLEETARAQVMPDNTRKIKEAGDDIYLLENHVGVAVLVECGFLSSFRECEKLSSEDYQKELCFALFCGIIKYIESLPDDREITV